MTQAGTLVTAHIDQESGRAEVKSHLLVQTHLSVKLGEGNKLSYNHEKIKIF